MRHSKGYIALIAVLIIGAAALSIALSLLTLGTDSQRESLVEQQSTQARSLATACAEEALQYIHDNTSDTSQNGSINNLGAGSCTYTITGASTSRDIVAVGTVGNVVRRVNVEATVGATSITIDSWREIAGTLATIARVQNSGSTNDASGNNLTRAYTSNVTSGNLLAVAISWDTASTTFTFTCSDSRGNSYTNIGQNWLDAANEQATSVCYATANSSGANTVTVTWPASVSFRRIIVSEYSGVATINPVDVVQGVGGGTATSGTNGVSSGSAVTTQNGNLIYGIVQDTSGFSTAITAGTGFNIGTVLPESTGFDFAVEDQVQTTAGSTAATFTFGNTHKFNAGFVAFKALLQ